MDKIELDDKKLDLSADHVFILETTVNDIAAYLDGNCELSELIPDETLDEAEGYANLEGKDAVIVIIIKAQG